MKRKTILLSVLLLVAILLVIAANTKPDDKTIKIKVVNELWGDKVPDIQMPEYYGQFMKLTTKAIDIDEETFFKRIKYTVDNKTATIGYAAFGKVFLRK